jgi:hypothetical protein
MPGRGLLNRRGRRFLEDRRRRATGSCWEERKRRIGENEGVFRSVNERIQPLDRDWMTILCECGQLQCRDQLVILRDEYAHVREDPTMFILRPGHETAETEEVVLKQYEYWIVRKNPGLPAAIARSTATG